MYFVLLHHAKINLKLFYIKKLSYLTFIFDFIWKSHTSVLLEVGNPLFVTNNAAYLFVKHLDRVVYSHKSNSFSSRIKQ